MRAPPVQARVAGFHAGRFGTADLADELLAEGAEIRACDTQLRQYGGLGRFAGTVRTVRCRDDNVLLRQLLETRSDGGILVVDGAASVHCALLGDRLASLALANGWVGLVLHAAVRDSAVLARLPLGVKALGTNPRKSGKAGAGAIDVPVTFGDVTFNPGDTLFSDDDGILLLA